MAARASFSNESRIVKMPLPKSVLLKDYLLDDLSSCSSNGFRSYPRRRCFTTVRYLIEIDLNKHMKLPPTQKHKSKPKEKEKVKSKPKSKSKSRSMSVLQRASSAVVNVFKQFKISGSGNPRKKACFLSRKLWRKTANHQNRHFERLKSFDDSIKKKESNVLPPSSSAVTTTGSNSNSNSSGSSESYFTIVTSDSSTTGGSSKINVAQNDVKATEKKNMAAGKRAGGATATTTDDSVANGNAKVRLNSYASHPTVVFVHSLDHISIFDYNPNNLFHKRFKFTVKPADKLALQNEEKEQVSPVSVMDFPCVDEDEVTSPYKHSRIYVKGRKQKLMPKVRKSKTLVQLEPIRLEDRITLSESRTQDSTRESSLQTGLQFGQEENHIEKKAIALLQLLKATMPSHSIFESKTTDSILLGFFIEQINHGNVSNLSILQEARDWINGNGREMESQNYKITYITDMEKAEKWMKYDDEEVGLELEFEVFTSLVEELLLEFYL
ncbi:hypothetical protein OSB04_022390 [Centaurea solstitialis]|uniref:DUF4378 domain-containing protein n=1 Tax=Centaurea solstitialis TaxID=347529 RepID=A0AA38W5W7_9ASTR|nr:hypothetical protein OSB04_022390 [Centaurea solstitialis]